MGDNLPLETDLLKQPYEILVSSEYFTWNCGCQSEGFGRFWEGAGAGIPVGLKRTILVEK